MQINLRGLNHLPVVFDTLDREFHYDTDKITIRHQKSYNLKKMQKQFLNPFTLFVRDIYKTYSISPQEVNLKKLRIKLNLNLILPGLVGVEFLKTRVKKIGLKPRILEVSFGKAIVLLQKPQKEMKLNKKNVYIITLRQKDKLIIPPEYAYVIINPSKRPSLVLEVKHQSDRVSKTLDKAKGGAFYIITRNGKMEIVKNPSYKKITKFYKFGLEPALKKLHISAKTPIIKQFIRKHEKFDWFYKKDSVKWSTLYS